MRMLTTTEKKELRNLHCKESYRRYADRIKTVLLLDDSFSYEEIAKILLLDDQTIRNYERLFEAGGKEKLLSNNYNGGQMFLSEEEIEKLKNKIKDNIYHSCEEIIVYIKEEFEKEYSISGITKLLNRIGFVYKKTKIIPAKVDVSKQKTFIKEYETLKKTKDKDDVILFMDGAHPQYNSVSSYCWIEKGKEKAVPAKTGRQRININAALNIENLNVTTRFEDTINALTTIDLLKDIEKEYKGKGTIYIIADNARYYRSKIVSEFLTNSSIKLVFLPPYSPNLNIIERLWKFFKKTLLSKCDYDTFHDFKQASRDFFDNIRIYKNKLSTLLTDNFQVLDNI